MTLECEICKASKSLAQSEIEEDVYAVNESILLACEVCGVSTNCRRTSAVSIPVAEPVFSKVLSSEPSKERSAVANQVHLATTSTTSAPAPHVWDSAPNVRAQQIDADTWALAFGSRLACAVVIRAMKLWSATTSPRADYHSEAAESMPYTRKLKWRPVFTW